MCGSGRCLASDVRREGQREGERGRVELEKGERADSSASNLVRPLAARAHGLRRRCGSRRVVAGAGDDTPRGARTSEGEGGDGTSVFLVRASLSSAGSTAAGSRFRGGRAQRGDADGPSPSQGGHRWGAEPGQTRARGSGGGHKGERWRGESVFCVCACAWCHADGEGRWRGREDRLAKDVRVLEGGAPVPLGVRARCQCEADRLFRAPADATLPPPAQSRALSCRAGGRAQCRRPQFFLVGTTGKTTPPSAIYLRRATSHWGRLPTLKLLTLLPHAQKNAIASAPLRPAPPPAPPPLRPALGAATSSRARPPPAAQIGGLASAARLLRGQAVRGRLQPCRNE
jgi:hypothetical protein